jgi:hypothetical protein
MLENTAQVAWDGQRRRERVARTFVRGLALVGHPMAQGILGRIRAIQRV